MGGVAYADDDGTEEQWLLQLEPSLAVPLTEPQRGWFGPGLAGAIAVHRSVHPKFLIGARLRGGFLFDGPAPDQVEFADPGFGTFSTLTASLRVRPLGTSDDPARGTGLFLEAGAGGTVTGATHFRAVLDVAMGYVFALGGLGLGPVVRYLQVFQPDDLLEPHDAKLLLVGLELTFLDGRAQTEEEREEEEAREGPRDTDGDGYRDPEDSCPQQPEDFDEFEDEDGCPDLDNDQDQLPDTIDQCPNDPEDHDEWEDDDGCPDLDNDNDGFPDVSDGCPDQPETVNGVDDQDGCPDEGLIEMIDDRIVLEEHVLFDFQRARVKHAARPVLDAIVELVRQHPEWVRMRIEGHADARGNAEYNQSLSERRARNVMRALVRAGMDRSTLESAGFGATQLRDQGTSEQAHQRNRRVEFVVVARRADLDSDDEPSGGGDEPDLVFKGGELQERAR